MNAYRDWQTFREIDTAAGWIKGTAFRRFKQIESGFREGTDYRVLHHQHDQSAIAQLRAAGRIYDSSVNVVLLAPPLQTALRQQPD